MKLIPLGGAEEVGATCTLVEIGGHRIMVDAGIRIGQPDPLPDLSRVSDFGGIEAILVTHAHTDHTGALPVVHRAYPAVPVYATPGTQAIVSVLMSDALNLMKNRYEVDREIPLYNRELVDSLFSRFQPVQLGQTIKLFGGDIAATFFPAGHILGAACIGLQSAQGESLFISGDISVTPQLTVGGMLPPVSVDRRYRPQVVMVESTYGNRLHANRAAEERRLTESVAEIVESGGRVLIPAFAVGRAQEVLLILANAMARKALPPFPVWVDGMVRSVCSVYTQHPYDLASALRRQITTRGNPFYGSGAATREADFNAISTPEERQALAESGKPGVIVASSGMLTGGPSAFFARYFARENQSAIFITGYQDEESPGRALLALAEATRPEERQLKLEGEPVQVVCRVAKYSLSAHVDAGEVAGLVEQLNPQETVLVHGAGGAREALSDLLVQSKDRRVNLPSAGDELTFAFRAAKPRLKPAATVQPDDTNRPALPTSSVELQPLRDKVVDFASGRNLPALTVQEVAQLWLQQAGNVGWEGELTAEEYASLRSLLANKESGFYPDPRRPFLFRPIKSAAEKPAQTTKSELPLEQNAALAEVDKLLPATTGLYRKGAQTAERKLVLYFYFPLTAVERYAGEIAEIARLTGWTVELNGETHQSALQEKLRELLPSDFTLAKSPGIYRELREVRATVAYSGPDNPPDLETVREAYRAETGFNLQITLAGEKPVIAVAPVDGSRMEINATFGLIEQAFRSAGITLYRKSLKLGQYIELAFLTAELGERYRETIESLSEQTGWPVKINPEPNQQALRELSNSLVKEAGLQVLNWGLHRDRRAVAVKIAPTDSPSLADLQARFEELTGWKMEF